MEKIQEAKDSVQIKKMISTRVIDLNKKRKLQAEQLDLPVSKHLCQDRTVSAVLLAIKEEADTGILVHEAEEESAKDSNSFEEESAKDSNSFEEDSDCVMSENEGIKPKSDSVTSCLCDTRSCSSECAGGMGLGTNPSQLPTLTATDAGVGKGEMRFDRLEHHLTGYDDEIQGLEQSEDHILKLQSHLEYVYSQCAGDGVGQSMGKDLGEIVYPSGGNPSLYVLSSGRWKVNKDAEPQTRKPTIDQEFEEYFSTLML